MSVCPSVRMEQLGSHWAGFHEILYLQWRTQEFCAVGGGSSTNSFEDRGQRERGSGGGIPLVRGPGSSCNLYKEFHFI